jgi:hypothetical protein
VTILIQFLFRLAFGLAAGMAVTSPRDVSSGYFRNHLWVILGLNTLAALAAAYLKLPLWLPITGAVLSYAGAIAWLYEKPRAGQTFLVLVSLLALAGAWQAQPISADAPWQAQLLARLDPLTGGLALGMTMAAMLLGHWYLNAPGMKLAPLRRLLVMMAIALAVRALLAGIALGLEATQTGAFSTGDAMTNILLVSLRWLWGLLGALGLTWMAWQTLKIPNTQSATGILYVAVIGTFLGELTSQLLSGRMVYPV